MNPTTLYRLLKPGTQSIQEFNKEKGRLGYTPSQA